MSNFKHYVRGRVVNKDIKPVESGFVELVQAPAGDIESIILKSARVSHNLDTIQSNSTRDNNLIKFLWKNKHTSPFEHVSFTFHISCPIFVARQWFRHRTGKYNELSARYTEMDDAFWFPEEGDLRDQSKRNHQCSGDGIVDADLHGWAESIKNAYSLYEQLTFQGVAREQARAVLPLNIMTRFYFTMDLHNLLHFLELRLAADAQPEIRYYAEAIRNIIMPMVPMTWAAFNDYTLSAVTFSGPEIKKIKELFNIQIHFGAGENGNKESKEAVEKLKKILG